MTIFHLAPAADWGATPDQDYAPASLSSEGFVHCTAGRERLVRVANLFYRDQPGPFLVIELDEALLDDVRWEAAAGGAPAGDEDALFPHVYGPLNRAAVVSVAEAPREADGTFV